MNTTDTRESTLELAAEFGIHCSDDDTYEFDSDALVRFVDVLRVEIARELQTDTTTPQTDGATMALNDEQIINIADSYSFTWDEGIIAFARALLTDTHAPAMAETQTDVERDKDRLDAKR